MMKQWTKQVWLDLRWGWFWTRVVAGMIHASWGPQPPKQR